MIDPTGVSLHGLENYKMAFGFIHGVVKVFYCDEKSGVTSVRVAYDLARKCIRYVCCGALLIVVSVGLVFISHLILMLLCLLQCQLECRTCPKNDLRWHSPHPSCGWYL